MNVSLKYFNSCPGMSFNFMPQYSKHLDFLMYEVKFYHICFCNKDYVYKIIFWRKLFFEFTVEISYRIVEILNFPFYDMGFVLNNAIHQKVGGMVVVVGGGEVWLIHQLTWTGI